MPLVLNPKLLKPDKYRRGVTTEDEKLTILRTLEIATRVDAPTFVEIGTHLALTSAMIVQALNDLKHDCEFVGVDIDQPQCKPPFLARDKWNQLVTPLEQPYAKARFDGTGSTVASLKIGPCAWVFVDGCHCHECVETEIRLYAPKVVVGGFILFHDCHPKYARCKETQPYHDGPPRPFGVLRAVTESEFLRDKFQLCCQTATMGKRKFIAGMAVFERVSG